MEITEFFDKIMRELQEIREILDSISSNNNYN